MGFKFRLFLENGEDIGGFETSVPVWRPGDQLYNRDHNRFLVTDVVEPDEVVDEDFAGILVVTPLELAEPG